MIQDIDPWYGTKITYQDEINSWFTNLSDKDGLELSQKLLNHCDSLRTKYSSKLCNKRMRK